MNVLTREYNEKIEPHLSLSQVVNFGGGGKKGSDATGDLPGQTLDSFLRALITIVLGPQCGHDSGGLISLFFLVSFPYFHRQEGKELVRNDNG